MTDLPDVKLKALISFPANVLDGTGVDVVKANGTYQFNLDFGDFTPPVGIISDQTHQNLLLWNSATSAYTLAPMALVTSGGVVSEAPNDGLKYARQSLTWTSIVSFPEAPNDGSQYARQSLAWTPVVIPTAGSMLGAIQGLTTGNNATDTNNDIDIAVGAVRDTTNAFDLILSAGITKRLDAVWAAGTNQGGLDTGAKANNTTYHVFLIRKTSDGTIDALFSTSPTLPTMPSGYGAKRRIWSILTDGSGNIRGYKQTGNWCQYKAAVVGFAFATTPALLATTITGLPLGIKILADLMIGSAGAAAGFVLVRDPDLGVPSVADALTCVRYRVGTSDGARHQVWTNTTGQVYLGDSAATPQMYINVFGWVDLRDQYQ